MSTRISTAPAATIADNAGRTESHRRLAGALVIANPLWVGISLIQAATRPGFDLTRYPLSMLASGDLGWIQITNFVVAGLLMIIGAVGLRRLVASRWTPYWVAAVGVGYILSGAFTLEHQMVAHLVVGILAFIALTAALITLAHHLVRTGRRAAAAVSMIAAAFVAAANVATTIGLPYPSLTLAIGVGTGMLGLSLVTAIVARAR